MFARTFPRRSAGRRHVRPAFWVESIETRRYCDGDNSFATAANLGTANTIITKSGSLTSSSDTKDYYKFTVPSGVTTFKTQLSGLTSNANLYLYNSSKSQIGSSSNGGTATDYISKQPLAAGTYYAEVRLSGSTTNYKLELLSDTAGSATGSARNIGELTAVTKTFSEYVGPLDSADYYKFNTTADGVLNVTLNGLSADANVQLLNSGGTVVQSNIKTGTAVETFIWGATPGTYYVRVQPATGSAATNYTLALKRNTFPSDPAGETLATAKTLLVDSAGVGSTTETVLNYFDTNDVYKVVATEPGLLYASLSNMTDDLDVAILNSAGTELARSSPTGFFLNLVLFDVPSGGTYYFKVLQHTTGTNASASAYSLSVNVPTDGAGNSIAAAKNVTPLYTANNAHVGGSVDTSDFYKFNSTDNTYIIMTLKDATASAKLRFYGGDGGLLFTETTSGGDADLSIFVHTGGVRYCSIAPSVAGTAVEYDLEIKLQAF